MTDVTHGLPEARRQADAVRRLDHDLRTPLAVVAGFAEHLEKSWTHLSEAEKLEGIEMILRNSRLLTQLMEQASTQHESNGGLPEPSSSG